MSTDIVWPKRYLQYFSQNLITITTELNCSSLYFLKLALDWTSCRRLFTFLFIYLSLISHRG